MILTLDRQVPSYRLWLLLLRKRRRHIGATQSLPLLVTGNEEMMLKATNDLLSLSSLQIVPLLRPSSSEAMGYTEHAGVSTNELSSRFILFSQTGNIGLREARAYPRTQGWEIGQVKQTLLRTF